VARKKQPSVLSRLFGGRDRAPSGAISRERIRKAEEKRRAAADATREWVALLREMETTGESSSPQYESYYSAYLQSREQEKRIDLELFNLRQGLKGERA
jgi:hypothetical protein